jgi:hypothetical protein
MYVARPFGHCCSGNTNILGVCVLLNYTSLTTTCIKMVSVTALTMLLRQIHVASNNKFYLMCG